MGSEFHTSWYGFPDPKFDENWDPEIVTPGSGIVNHEVEDVEVDDPSYIYIKGGPDIKVEVRISGVTFQGLYTGRGSIYIGILV
jgi:hypothetical protein